MAEVPNLGAAAARERAAEEKLAEEITEAMEAPQPIPVSTAFVVVWRNGEVSVLADLDAPIVVNHLPTPDEILGAAAVLAADRTAERTAGLSAQIVVGTIEQKQKDAMAAMQAARDQAMGQALLQKGHG